MLANKIKNGARSEWLISMRRSEGDIFFHGWVIWVEDGGGLVQRGTEEALVRAQIQGERPLPWERTRKWPQIPPDGSKYSFKTKTNPNRHEVIHTDDRDSLWWYLQGFSQVLFVSFVSLYPCQL